MSEIIDKLAQTVDGSKKSRDITVLTLSTCMWCKKCKAWLDEHDVKYKYVDVDRINFEDKSKIMDHIINKYNSRISYPFMICDDEVVVGYNPNKYEELLKSGGN